MGGANALLAKADASSGSESGLKEELVWQAACGDEGPTPHCPGFVAQMAIQRIQEVRDHYMKDQRWYEANLTEVLGIEVKSARALSSGHLELALQLGQQASELEVQAVAALLPSSTSLYFLPGTAYNGALALRLSTTPWATRTGRSETLLKVALRSFDQCLAPAGRPNLSACLLGRARTARALSSGPCSRGATLDYMQLMKNWLGSDLGEPAEHGCREAYGEVKDYMSMCAK